MCEAVFHAKLQQSHVSSSRKSLLALSFSVHLRFQMASY